MFAVGVDIGGTSVKIGVFDESGKITARSRINTRHENNCSHVLEDTADEIIKLLKYNNIALNDVIGIGIGVPGPVVNGIVEHCVNLQWKTSVDVADKIYGFTGLRALVLNDANAAALGEQWMGAGKGHSNMVFVTIGTGIGGGIIVDGNILTGVNGAGGEIGHITVRPDSERQCSCGRYGCLETYASATGIVRTAKELLENGSEPSALREMDITAENVFRAAGEKDHVAMKAVENFGICLGQALANIALVTDPEIIALGGGVSQAGETVRSAVERHYRASAFMSVKETKIVTAELGNDAGIYGAAREAIKRYLGRKSVW